MDKIVLIGNSPSSGSTFLADILDSSDIGICGPELSFFSNKNVFDYKRFRSRFFAHAPTPSIYKEKNRIYYHNLKYYGSSKYTFPISVRRHHTLKEFSQFLFEKYCEQNHREEARIFFEKSPENICSVGAFLDAFPNGYFIHLVRNPLSVFNSLFKRGFSKPIALLTWFFDVVQILPFRNHPRVITLRYEDLVHGPFDLVHDLFIRLGESNPPTVQRIQENYENNALRQSISRPKSWSVNQPGIAKKKRSEIDPAIKQYYSKVQFFKISTAYAKAYGILETSLIDLVKTFDYFSTDMEALFKEGRDEMPDMSTFLSECQDFLRRKNKLFNKHHANGIDLDLSPISIK